MSGCHAGSEYNSQLEESHIVSSRDFSVIGTKQVKFHTSEISNIAYFLG